MLGIDKIILRTVFCLLGFYLNFNVWAKDFPQTEFFSRSAIDSLQIKLIQIQYDVANIYCSHENDEELKNQLSTVKFYFDHVGKLENTWINDCSPRIYGYDYSYYENGTIKSRIGKSDASSRTTLDVFNYIYDSTILLRQEYELVWMRGSIDPDREGRDEFFDILYTYYNNGLLKSECKLETSKFYVYQGQNDLIGYITVSPEQKEKLQRMSFVESMSFIRDIYSPSSILDHTYQDPVPKYKGDHEIISSVLSIDGIPISIYLLEKRASKANHVVFEVATNEFIFYKINKAI